MKQLLASCAIAFSTYSRIPMPQVEWSEKNMRYTLSFFPLVGVVIGVLFWLADVIGYQLGLGMVLRSAILTALPVAVTGGIHLDGYCDTVDALASHAGREKKLAILKDSAAGAFAVIWCCVWFLVYFGLMTEMGGGLTTTVAAGFLLSRTLSALAVDRLPSARAGMALWVIPPEKAATRRSARPASQRASSWMGLDRPRWISSPEWPPRPPDRAIRQAGRAGAASVSRGRDQVSRRPPAAPTTARPRWKPSVFSR